MEYHANVHKLFLAPALLCSVGFQHLYMHCFMLGSYRHHVSQSYTASMLHCLLTKEREVWSDKKTRFHSLAQTKFTNTANLNSCPPWPYPFPNKCWKWVLFIERRHILIWPKRTTESNNCSLKVLVFQWGPTNCQDDFDDHHTSHATKQWNKHFLKNSDSNS